MKRQVFTIFMSLAVGATMTGRLSAAPKTFDFKDPKGVNAITIGLDSLLEPIVGFADGISGEAAFDPADLAASHGHIVVATESIRMSNPTMTKVLHSDAWLDVAKNPEVRYTIETVDAVKKTDANTWELAVTGPFTLNGITQKESVTLTLTHLPGRLKDRNHEGSGDLLVVRATFAIDRTRYAIKPDLPPFSVARTITLGVRIVGAALDQ